MGSPLTDGFASAMRDAGLEPPASIEAGQLHRFPAPGKSRSNRAAWCRLFPDGAGGVFGDWSTGIFGSWQAKRDAPLTPAERAEFRRRVEEARRQAEAEREAIHAEAATRASSIWNAAQPAPADHAYLVRKGIKPSGARLHDGALVVQIRCDGALVSLQFIAPDGSKKFLPGGRVAGGYFAIGTTQGAAGLCIAEGFATAAGIHAATGHPVAVAFNCGNLLPVAQAMRGKFPDLPLIICADDDAGTDGNPGLTKAREAASAVGALLAVPDFGPDRPAGATDFNDLAAHGLEAVRACVEAAAPVCDTAKSEAGRQSFPYNGGRFEVSKAAGVVYIQSRDGEEQPPRWICAELRVSAKTRDAASNEWGRLLTWRDADGVEHRWPMPLELLQGDGADVRRELARRGLDISPARAARDLLGAYVQTAPVAARARCVDRLGWSGGAFVTPGAAIGGEGEEIVFQHPGGAEPAFSEAGTAAAWRDSVGALASGNSRLIFAISAAFAGPLADIAGEPGGGFHLRGPSSCGKSTALAAAASVWGDPARYPRLWRATANGLEGLAALHNDGLLILDELGQLDPRAAGESAYLLANGQGKTRAARTGTARQAARWRLLFLSAGEVSLSTLMASAGHKPHAGQEVRLCDISADAGAGLGLFEDLRGHATPAALALAIKDAAAKCHGAVGMAWLRRVVADRQRLGEIITDGVAQFVDEALPEGASAQAQRVARRFGLVAVAGELATHYGLTTWRESEAADAAHKCFASWLEGFGGTTPREDAAALAQVRAFIESHGASRFEQVDADGPQRVIVNRAGFVRTDPATGQREYLVLPEAYRREVCQGLDHKAVTAALIRAGWLTPAADGTPSQKPRLRGFGTMRCYVLNGRLWEDDYATEA